MLNIIIEQTEKESKRGAIKDSKRYIVNNWKGIKNRYQEECCRCSAEGHISHILSSRLSSRPLGWSLIGADQMAKLRVYNENGGDIYDIMSLRKEEKNKEQRMLKLEKRVIKKKLKTSLETLDNIPAINDGKGIWRREYFKSLIGT